MGEDTPEQGGRYVGAVNRVREIATGDAAPETKLRDLLRIGRDLLALSNAHLTHIEPTADYWEAVQSTDLESGPVVPGDSNRLGNTYCREVIETGNPLVLHHAAEQGWDGDPAYHRYGLESYVGVPISVRGEAFGTACFVAEQPRPEPFGQQERAFALHLTRELGRIMERCQLENELKRRHESNAVLHRLLRHNLRHDVTVIRGRAHLLADAAPNSVADRHLSPLLSAVENLETISEKSQLLEPAIAEPEQRPVRDLATVVEKAVESVQEEYPAARYVTNAPAIELPLAETIEPALIELVENAAKHAGPSPLVTVDAEADEQAAEITVTDNGPGVPPAERRAIEGGIESDLHHASGLGLWLVAWIVDSHDGEIELPETPTGARVRVRLPFGGSSLAT